MDVCGSVGVSDNDLANADSPVADQEAGREFRSGAMAIARTFYGKNVAMELGRAAEVG